MINKGSELELQQALAYMVANLFAKESEKRRQSTIELLGNVVISNKFLRTCKIMVMHSNKRGECDLRTLVDRQRKR